MPRFEDLAAEGQALVEVGGAVVGVDVATQAELDAVDAAKAPLASPALTGTPTVPTAPAGTNTTQAASTAFVKGEVDNATSTHEHDADYVNVAGGDTITASGAAVIPLVIKGAAGQTANLVTVQDSAGTVLVRVAAAGTIATADASSFLLHPTNVTQNLLGSTAANRVPLVVKGAAGQTANLQDWANSAGAVVASVSATGVITATMWDGTTTIIRGLQAGPVDSAGAGFRSVRVANA